MKKTKISDNSSNHLSYVRRDPVITNNVWFGSGGVTTEKLYPQ